MYQLDWAIKSRWEKERNDFSFQSNFETGQVDLMVNIRWEEHCVECAVPECYSTCALYDRREDNSCARFDYGIVANPQFKGLYGFGADIRFRKWAKLETALKDCFSSPILSHQALTEISGTSDDSLSRIGAAFNKSFTYNVDNFSFLFECFSPEITSYKLILEYFTERARIRTTIFRTSLQINPGKNVYEIPAVVLGLKQLEGYLYLYPENNNEERRIIFTWLDLIQLRSGNVIVQNPAENKKEELIKCVAWDLDNTLWRGIVSEDAEVTLNADAVQLVKDLDSRGILQTIVSKNDHDVAWKKLVELNLSEFFLFPEINWGPKSESIKRIASNLNIDVNTFALIDDSPYERAEVMISLPVVRAYSDIDIENITGLSEFNVPVSEEGRKRRSHYLSDANRQKSKEKFSGSYFDFLVSCEIKASIFRPARQNDIDRCYELVQRSNQLNLNTRRYTREEFSELLTNDNVQPLAIRCSDKFGDYGIVGFSTLEFIGSKAVVGNFVISCRAAQKKVENAFFKTIALYLFANGFVRFEIPFVPSMKNQPLFKVLEELSLRRIETEKTFVTYVAEKNMPLKMDVPVQIDLHPNSFLMPNVT